MPFIDGEHTPSPDCNKRGELATHCFSGGVHGARLGVVAAPARERLARLLSIQRTVPHCLVGSIGGGLQFSVGEHHCDADRATAPRLSLFTGGNLHGSWSL